ncbi:uncharacterized protein BDZ99DRAFT_501526 [Mytilinidion resinicola]|uniref:Uncharacterized protein n=1 Tax=Mytilinidion resinicola TaxID=574789 RepID=A0A6A6YBI9_9PEZI|nr:uncharacterized protein BDZ99DRAFT_501526 [Mytilinidion resinicola]KAF2805989.1 hypothetical protein BDZ99DRAFT_501526 [Mytilinidion resinicola]
MHCFEALDIPLAAMPDDDLQELSKKCWISTVFPKCRVGQLPRDLIVRIRDYIQRNLTNDYDSLHAFNGILRRFAMMENPVENILGVPIFPQAAFRHWSPEKTQLNITEKLLFGLDWNSEASIRRHVLPSWTWAEWKLDPDHEDVFKMELSYKDDSDFFSYVTDDVEYNAGGYHPDYLWCNTFPLSTISFEFKGSVLPWAEEHEEIIKKASSNSPPTHVQIHERLFDVNEKYLPMSLYSIGDKPSLAMLGEFFLTSRHSKCVALILREWPDMPGILLGQIEDPATNERVGHFKFYEHDGPPHGSYPWYEYPEERGAIVRWEDTRIA